MTFFDKYSFKQKNYAIGILFILLVAVSYKRVFSTTIETGTYRDELEEKLLIAQNADQQIKTRYAQIAGLNRYLGEENQTVEKVQQGFLNFFAKKADGLTVFQIDEVLNFKHPDFEINTHRIVMKGAYTNSLKFIYELERDFEQAKVLNISFDYRKYSSEDQMELYTTLLIQNYLR